MSGHIRQYRIRNECIKEKVSVASIVEKIVKSHFRWFGHIRRRPVVVEAPGRRIDRIEGSSIVRGRERPRKTIDETIKKYLDFTGLTIDMVYNRTLWHCLNHVVPHIVGQGLFVVIVVVGDYLV